MVPRLNIPKSTAQQVSLKGIAFQVDAQAASALIDKSKALLIPPVAHDGPRMITCGKIIEGIVLIGSGKGQAEVDEFLAGHMPAPVSYMLAV
jgi:hypothetical protein